MIDWDLIETWVIGTAIATFVAGFILSAFVRLLFYEMLSNPSVQAIVKAAQKWGGGKGGGVLENVAQKAAKWFFG